MSSVDQLLIILFAIYLSECPLYLRDGAFAVGQWLARWSAWSGEIEVGRSGGALTLLSPLPWEIAHVCEPWPVAVSEAGLASVAGITEASATNAIAWDDVRTIDADGRWLRVNAARFAECGSDAMAKHLATLFGKMRTATPPKRPEQIRAALAAAFDANTASERWSTVGSGIRRLRVAATLLFLVTFVLVPIADRMFPVWTWAPWMAVAIVLLVILNKRWMKSVMRHCPELTKGARFKASLVTTVSPVAAMRSPQLAAAHLLPLHHPLAIAAAVGPTSLFNDLAARFWRELHFPLGSSEPVDDSVAAHVVTSYTEQLAKAMGAALISSRGVDSESFLAPPEPESPDVVAYCPRCLGQFCERDARCHTCGNRPVVLWPEKILFESNPT